MAELTTIKQRKAPRIWVANALRSVADIYEGLERYAQPVENSRDAGASTCYVVVSKEGIDFIDDGKGMVPYVLDKDRKWLDEIFDYVGRGEIPPFNINDVIPEGSPSRSSLEWTRDCVNLSPKPAGSKNKGMRGLGILAYLAYADRATLYTYPTQALEVAYWGTSDEHRYVYAMDLPSNTGIDNSDPSYSDAYLVEDMQITDPFGVPLEHGTCLQVREFNENIDIKPQNLVSFFRDRFAGDLEEGFKLVVVDRITKPGQKEPLGRILPVEPLPVTGELIIDELLEVNKLPFRVRLFFDPTEKKSAPAIRHKLGNKMLITALDRFQDGVWNCGQFKGFVEFPAFLSENRIWTTAKQGINLNRDAMLWVQMVHSRYTERLKKIAETRANQEAAKAYKKIVSQVASAAEQAMSEEEAFKEFSVGFKPRKKRGVIEAPPSSPRMKDIVRGVVFNEHKRGATDIRIELTREGEPIGHGVTKRNGAISFHKQAPGKYHMYIVVPPGVAVRGASEHFFEINPYDESRMGFNGIFEVVTGEPAPPDQTRHKMDITIAPFPDASRPWAQLLHIGLININRSHSAMSAAERKGDMVAQRTLIAAYVAAAITDYCIESDRTHVLMQFSRLFSRMDSLMRKLDVEQLRSDVPIPAI